MKRDLWGNVCSWWGVVEDLFGSPGEGGPCQADKGKSTPKPLPFARNPKKGHKVKSGELCGRAETQPPSLSSS